MSDPTARLNTVALALDNLGVAVCVFDADGRIGWVNDGFIAMHGLAGEASVIGTPFQDVYREVWRGFEGDGAALCAQGLAALEATSRFDGVPFEVPLPGGRSIRVVARRGGDDAGSACHALVDVTELKQQHQALIAAQAHSRDSDNQLTGKSELLEAMLDRMDQGIMMVNAQRIVEVCNRRAIELLGLPPELMAARPRFEDVLAFQWQTDEFAHTPADIRKFVEAGGILDQPHRYDRKRPNGRVIEIHSVPIEGGGVLRTYTDITERKHHEERIRHVSRHDGLTALANREVFLEQLAMALETAQRTGDSFAVHYLDLDRFKPINDRLGHVVGDKLLAGVAQRMRKIARDTDVVARMGGDEFAVLQHHVEQPDAAIGLGVRMLEGVTQPIEIEAHQLHVGVSIGIALYPSGGASAEDLLRNADAALYDAKKGGGDSVRVYTGSGDLSVDTSA